MAASDVFPDIDAPVLQVYAMYGGYVVVGTLWSDEYEERVIRRYVCNTLEEVVDKVRFLIHNYDEVDAGKAAEDALKGQK